MTIRLGIVTTAIAALIGLYMLFSGIVFLVHDKPSLYSVLNWIMVAVGGLILWKLMATALADLLTRLDVSDKTRERLLQVAFVAGSCVVTMLVGLKFSYVAQ